MIRLLRCVLLQGMCYWTFTALHVVQTFCEGQSNKTLSNLAGLRSSHTGYARTVCFQPDPCCSHL